MFTLSRESVSKMISEPSLIHTHWNHSTVGLRWSDQQVNRVKLLCNRGFCVLQWRTFPSPFFTLAKRFNQPNPCRLSLIQGRSTWAEYEDVWKWVFFLHGRRCAGHPETEQITWLRHTVSHSRSWLQWKQDSSDSRGENIKIRSGRDCLRTLEHLLHLSMKMKRRLYIPLQKIDTARQPENPIVIWC